jgi:SAM-dependent methyltransferase
MLGKIRNSVERRGVLGSLKWGWTVACDRIEPVNPRMRLYRRWRQRVEADYDRQHGVDTGGEISLDDVEIAGKSRRDGNKYQGALPDWIRSAIKKLDVDHSTYSFFDIGSGKGRVLLIAAEFPFRCVVGVEFGRELHEVAAANIVGDQLAERRQCRDVTSVWADATEYRFPDGNLAIFLNNPFSMPLLNGFLTNLRASCASAPRDLRVVFMGYLQPEYPALFEQHEFVALGGGRTGPGCGYSIYAPRS